MKEYYPTLKAKMLLYSNKSDSYLLVISHSIGNGGIIKSYVYHECNCDPQFRLNRSRLYNSNILGVLSLTWKKGLLHLWKKDLEHPELHPFGIIKCKCLKLFEITVQSRSSDIKFSDNLRFSDYFTKTVFQSTT